MRDPFGLFQENISVSYAHVLLEITEAYGIENQTVLHNTGLVLSAMKHADAKMSAHQWSKLVVNALQLTGNHRLGIEYGLKLRPTSHGALGFAFLSCADVETALTLCQQYFCTRIQNFTPEWTVDQDFVYVYLDDVHPVRFGDEQQSAQLRSFLVECLIFGAIHFLSLFSKELIEQSEVSFLIGKKAMITSVLSFQKLRYILVKKEMGFVFLNSSLTAKIKMLIKFLFSRHFCIVKMINGG